MEFLREHSIVDRAGFPAKRIYILLAVRKQVALDADNSSNTGLNIWLRVQYELFKSLFDQV